MHSRNPKRAALLGFAAGAAVLAMTSAAFACTSTMGMTTIQGPNGVTLTNSGTGADETEPHTKGFCAPPTRVAFQTPATAVTMQFSLAVEMVTDCPTALNYNSLPEELYEVRWINAVSDDIVFNDPSTNCLNSDPTQSPWQVVGVMNVAPNPSGPDGFGNYSLPATMRGPGNICAVPAIPNIASPPVIHMKWTVV